MKFGAKLLDSVNITHFTHVIQTVSRLCAKSANDKSCILKLTPDSVYFILPEFASNNIGSGGLGRTSFWISLDPKCYFDFYVVEGKSIEEDFILLEIQPECLLQTLKSSPNVKMVRIKLTKRQTPCLTVELDLHSMTSRVNSRTITHDISIRVISAKMAADDIQEPDISRTSLSIELPPLKLLKHMIERFKVLSDFVYFEATNNGTLELKVEADAVSVGSYFRNLKNLPIFNQNETSRFDTTMNDDQSKCIVRLSLKKLHDFINALQFTPTKVICNFVDQKYAHFFVVHDEDLVLQYLISSVLS